jgi:hypothetical protein
MHKWSVHGNVVEVSDYDYFNHWIGVIQVTNSLGGLLGGYFDIHDKNGNILEKHAKYLQENISLVEDQDFRNRLNSFEAQFQEVIALDQEAFATLSQVLRLEPPKKTRDYKALYKKLESENNLINAHGLFSHPAFVELRQRFMKVIEERQFQKEELISYILAVFPDATRSEYLRNG